ncbi:Kelch repeat-containing protein [Myxococcus fulvus]|uniref:Kelch repeat-containing protein n=1 Tax=Myxococcus fulvus TaxID=33 RepID=UPI003B99E0D2
MSLHRTPRGVVVLLAVAALVGCGVEVSLPPAERDATPAASALAAARWDTTGPMSVDRRDAAMVRLASGKVLVTGGFSTAHNAYLSGTELYDPATRTWSFLGNMLTPRSEHPSVLLQDGRVLVAGGYTASGRINNAEIFNPATNTWTSAGTIGVNRSDFTLTLLNNGRVLAAGGNYTTPLLYNPATNAWSNAGPAGLARQGSTATLLLSGKVLVTGGWNGTTTATTQLYDPSTGTWSAGPTMAAPRDWHTATRLPDGRVLITGGWTHTGPSELYNPSTNTLSPVGAMTTTRAHHIAALVDGKVLVSGGHTNGDRTMRQSAELFDPATNSWSLTTPMRTARTWHTGVELEDGTVLVAGLDRSAELYFPETAAPGQVAQGNTCSATGTFSPSCAFSISPAFTHVWTAPVAGIFTFHTLGSDFDTVLELVDDSTQQSLGCNDESSSGNSQSSVSVSLNAGQRVRAVVQGYSVNCGNFVLSVIR